MADRLADQLNGFLTRLGLPVEGAEPVAQSLVGMIEHTVGWWTKGREIGRGEVVRHLRLVLWDVVEGELRRADIQVGLDDPLPFAAGSTGTR
jgi:hypothetical protein